MDIQKEREAFLKHMRNIGAANFMFELDEDGNFDDMSMAYAWSAWQAAKSQAVPKCTWLQNEDGYFDTSCRQSFVFTEPEDKPHDHRFTHCCFCGGRLIEAQEPAND